MKTGDKIVWALCGSLFFTAPGHAHSNALIWEALAQPVRAAAEPRNVRMELQEATDSGTIRWVQPQQANPVNPPITGYEWEAAVNGVIVDSGTVPASAREARFDAPAECGETVTVTSRVRPTNPAAAWHPGPWGASPPQDRMRPCAVVAPGAPDVEMELDTVVAGPPPPPPPTDTVRPDQVLTLTYIGDNTLAWVQVSDGAGGHPRYLLRRGCPTWPGWGQATTEVVVDGTGPVGEQIEHVVSPPSYPCVYALSAFRGGEFGNVSNLATVTQPTEPPEPAGPSAFVPAIVRSNGSFQWAESFTLQVGEGVALCWYGVSPAPEHGTAYFYGKWPSECPDPSGSYIDGATELPAYPGSSVLARCAGNAWVPGTSFDQDCDGIARWRVTG